MPDPAERKFNIFYAASDDDVVYVPVPRHLLPALYRALAQTIGETTESAQVLTELAASSGEPRRNLIDFIIHVAVEEGADRHPVSLAELHKAYMHMYAGIHKGATRGSFDTTVNSHCINMRSRFPDANERQKNARWLSQPVFKRVARARYMLLSADELAQFQRCVMAGNPLIYADEYNIADLEQCQ